MPRRKVHLGVDYGTSAAKLVARDYGAPGGETAHVVTRPATGFKFPTGVAVGQGYVWLGVDPKDVHDLVIAHEAELYESVKMRVAAAAAPGSAAVLHLPDSSPPEGLSWDALAIVSVWWLISEGHRFALGLMGPSDELAFGVTMGAPTSFVQDDVLRSTFLNIVRCAWRLFRSHGPLARPLLTVKSVRELVTDDGDKGQPPPATGSEWRDWLRSEAEAALWWALQSPNVAAGPYIKVDVGAGTTNVSLFRIVAEHRGGRWVPTRICFFAAVSGSDAMDAIDAALAAKLGVDATSLRGKEGQLAVAGGLGAALEKVLDSIEQTCARAWKAASPKIGFGPERQAWLTQCRVFLLGGGGTFAPLVARVMRNPYTGCTMRDKSLEMPRDLRIGSRGVAVADLRFLMSAYGLSVIGLAIPDVDEADDVDDYRRRSVEWDDPYAK